MDRQVNGPAIAAIRKLSGITQAGLAQRSGISPSHMNKIESGAEKPKFETAVRIARELGVPIDAIAPVTAVPAAS
jgi:transcriptional regulator with XRE-family HTH domain